MVRHSSVSPYPVEACQASPRFSSVAVVTGAVMRDRELPSAPGVQEDAVSFRLLDEVGRGGMGVVFRAQQLYPQRIVALKIMKGELADIYAHRRFQREIELLARLNHPGIAQLFSAGLLEGTANAKSPFLAMEFVHGQPLVSYAQDQHLSREQRVRLFVKVCDILAYAHRQGVIHRDLKPSNILVEDRGEPKLLDFGLAAGSGDADRLTSQLTIPGQMVGTLDYMSPEQAEGNTAQIDQQSDVYALGVVLYELLTTRRPFDFTGQNLVEAVQAIKSCVPPPMSAVSRTLRGDLDTIVHKAMAKEKSQRYASAEALAEDLRRYLAHEPIRAHRPSMPYLASRFVRRNRMLVTAVVAVILALSIGLILAEAQARKARASEARALGQARRADQEAERAKKSAREAHAAAIRLRVLLADNILHGGDPYRALRLYNEALTQLGESPLKTQLGIFDAENPDVQLIQQWESRPAKIETMAISPDETWAMMACHDGRVILNTLLKQDQRLETRLPTSVEGVSFSPKGQFVAFFAGADFQVWSLEKGAKVHEGTFPARRISAVALSDDTEFWALDGREIRLGSLGDGHSNPHEFPVPQGIRTMAYTQTGLMIVDENFHVLQADPANGTLHDRGGMPVSGAAKVVIAPDGKHAAVLSGSHVIIFDNSREKVTAQLDGYHDPASFGFVDSGSVFSSKSGALLIDRIDLSGKVTHSVPIPDSVTAAFSHNFALIAIPDGPVLLWAMLPTPDARTQPLIQPSAPGIGSRSGERTIPASLIER